MARPNKTGLEYFPLNVDFFEDEKIEAIAGEFGIKGELTAIKLLCAVYNNGYFAVWNELFKMKLLKRLPGISPELLEQIVTRLVAWGFFDKALFNSDKILTSNGIQKRYSEATKRRKDSPPMRYVCSNGVNVNINSPLSAVIVDINSQSKVKESKGEEEYTRDEVFELGVLRFFGLNQIAHPDKMMLLGAFCKVMFFSGQLQHFKNQFESYQAFKSMSGYKHSFNNFLGKQESQFTDGQWNAENWEQRLKEEISLRNGQKPVDQSTNKNLFGV